MSVAALYRASNLIAMDYPFEASLASAMDFCDEAVIVLGKCEDETRELVWQQRSIYGSDRVKIREHEWVFDSGWQERVWAIGSGVTQADWLMFIDADEVIHDCDTPVLRTLLGMDFISFINFPFVHLYGTASWSITPKAGWLTRNTRLGRRSAGYRMKNLVPSGGSACAMVYRKNGKEANAHSMEGPTIHRTKLPIFHYGWARSAAALSISQRKHHAWYKNDASLFDGHIPEVPPWDFRMAAMYAEGKIETCVLDHPRYIEGWMEEHRIEWEELDEHVVEHA